MCVHRHSEGCHRSEVIHIMFVGWPLEWCASKVGGLVHDTDIDITCRASSGEFCNNSLKLLSTSFICLSKYSLEPWRPNNEQDIRKYPDILSFDHEKVYHMRD